MPWCGQSLDEKRGIVYIATKTAEPDFYGGSRHGKNLFANCILALDATTGKRLWHFQIVHHDLLDKDLPCPPVLVTVNHGGKRIDAVAQGTKHGLLFVFDRVTGKPLWPIEERKVPASDLRGEQAWPTQPFPTKPLPLMRQRYTEGDVSNISPETKQMTLDRIRASPNFGPFPAPSLKETVMFPGFDGGMEWGGGAADPEGIYYVNINEMPWLMQMVETRRADGKPLVPGERDYMLHCAACHGFDRKGNAAAEFPSLIDIDKRKTRAEIEQITRQGGGRMPGYATMGEVKRKAILDYVLNEKVAPSAVPVGIEKQPPSYAFGGFRRWLDAGRLSRHQTAMGNLERRRFEQRRDQMEGALGRIPGTDCAWHRSDGHGELRRTSGHRKRTHLYRGHGRRNLSSLRQGERQSSLADEVTFQRQCDSKLLHDRWAAVRCNLGRRGKIGPPGGREPGSVCPTQA